ncbi:MAG: T9SS type A sorting domain-containing protein [Burkholderiales bacterium]|nr:T9SS type A sorting domain-containing protein [Bacteroidia bacterium]
MKQIKKSLQFCLIIVNIIFFNPVKAQTISNHFFGQNAWMPDTIGNALYYGKLHKQWSNIKDSKSTFIRFGGIGADKNMPTNYQYIKMIDSIRAKGMEPIIQVPFDNWKYSAQQAANIVNFINVTKGRNIKYWSIGNEPDLGYSYTNSTQVANYLKAFATAMKNVDPSILIMGPETAWFNTNIINGLTTPNGPDDITGKDANGHYYLDIISFHSYAFDGSQSRAQVVSKLSSPGGLQDNLIYLNNRIATCNTAHNRTGSSVLKTAITEANIGWQNNAGDNLNGTGANSFVGGQFWAEMIGVSLKNGVDFINFWSVIEGNSNALNIGYIDQGTGTKKPIYYHFKLLAENLKGNYVNGTTNQANVKSFGSQNSQQIAVVILNEDLTANHNFRVKLNTASIAGTNTLKININANLATEYTDVIQAQSTVLLIFNTAGVLIKKYEYTLNSHAVANLAPTMTQYIATGVEEQENGENSGPDFEIKNVFPNPTNAKVTIQLNKPNREEREYGIEVFDMQGRLVLTKKSDFFKGNEELDLSQYNLASAMYIVRVKYQKILRTAKIMYIK